MEKGKQFPGEIFLSRPIFLAFLSHGYEKIQQYKVQKFQNSRKKVFLSLPIVSAFLSNSYAGGETKPHYREFMWKKKTKLQQAHPVIFTSIQNAASTPLNCHENTKLLQPNPVIVTKIQNAASIPSNCHKNTKCIKHTP